jgi:hypothetical protein
MAMSFNIIITPIFWLALAKFIFNKDLIKCLNDETNPQHGFCRYYAFSEACIHSVPLLFSITEIMCTKMVFLHRDSWYMAAAGVTYTLFNAVGCYILKTVIYPYPFDWSTNSFLTLFCYLLQAPILYFINECIATCTQRRRHHHEAGYKTNLQKDIDALNTSIISEEPINQRVNT